MSKKLSYETNSELLESIPEIIQKSKIYIINQEFKRYQDDFQNIYSDLCNCFRLYVLNTRLSVHKIDVSSQIHALRPWMAAKPGLESCLSRILVYLPMSNLQLDEYVLIDYLTTYYIDSSETITWTLSNNKVLFYFACMLGFLSVFQFQHWPLHMD